MPPLRRGSEGGQGPTKAVPCAAWAGPRRRHRIRGLRHQEHHVGVAVGTRASGLPAGIPETDRKNNITRFASSVVFIRFSTTLLFIAAQLLLESVFLRLIAGFTGAHWHVPPRPQHWPWPGWPWQWPRPWRPLPCRCQARSCQPRTPSTATGPGTC